MTTTYSVNWRTGAESPVHGLLEITSDAVLFSPAADGVVERVTLADVSAVHMRSSIVELERHGRDPVRIESAASEMLASRLEAAVELADALQSLRAEHDRIREELGELRIAVACLATLEAARAHEVGLLAIDLMRRIVRHAHSEEQELYSVVEHRLGCRPLVDAMVFDHRAIEDEACDLVRIEAGDLERLACVFHRLDALATTHMAKEEAIVLPLLDTAQ